MTGHCDSHKSHPVTDIAPGANERLGRLAIYRALEFELDARRRQQTARRRLLSLRSAPWDWLAV